MSGQTVKKMVAYSQLVLASSSSAADKDYFEKTRKLLTARMSLSYLLPAYQNRVSRTHLEKLVSVVSQALPHSMIPIRSNCAFISPFSPRPSSAQNLLSTRTADDKVMEENWISMVPELADFALRADITPVPVSRHGISHGLSRLIPRGRAVPSLTLLTLVVPSYEFVGSRRQTDNRGKRAELCGRCLSSSMG
jgi:hypothetical protein